MSVIVIAVGVVLIAAILWEVFNDLFHPAGHGALSDWLARSLFNLFRRAPRFLPMAGPLSLVLVIASWVAGLVVGFALLYMVGFPADFRTSTGTVPGESGSLLSALYFSFETLITLGYGDLVPASHLMRFMATLEALIGFGLLTASVSSIVLLYPALARARLLARTAAHAVEAQRLAGISLARADEVEFILQVGDRVRQLRVDLMHFPIVYYFATQDPNASVARWTGDLAQWAQQAHDGACSARMQLAGYLLEAGLRDLSKTLATRFLHVGSDDPQAIFQSYARDHVIEGWSPG
jgi:hypothetical protein